jgi:hypothetical protein
VADIEVKVGDTLPQFDVTLTEGDIPVDLTGAQIRVEMRNYKGEIVVQGAADAAPHDQGRVVRPWGDDETSSAQRLTAEVIVTKAEGRRTYPTEGQITVAILERSEPLQSAIDPEDVAAEFGLGILSPANRTRLAAKLADQISVVERKLRRPITPRIYEGDVRLGNDGKYAVQNGPLVEVLSETPLTDGSGRIHIVYRGGLDVQTHRALRAYVTSHAVADYRATMPDRERRTQSITVEGQSKTYVTESSTEGSPGGPTGWGTISGLKRQVIYQRPRAHDPFEREVTGVWDRYHWVTTSGLPPEEQPGWGQNEYGQQDEWPGFQG